MDEETYVICPNCGEENNRLDYVASTSGTEWGTVTINSEGELENYEYSDHENNDTHDYEFRCIECNDYMSEDFIRDNTQTRGVERQSRTVEGIRTTEDDLRDRIIDAEKVNATYGRIQTFSDLSTSTNIAQCPKCNNMQKADSEDYILCTNPECNHEYQLSELTEKLNAN